ncbi:SpoIIE family protein phosphatase [Flammeovirga sp. MY04]|uniref:PP2C family protein-serine/threonine phosphatase n=1 Tax=Flammeovirga sp. MY04 TaxID=1191459 RepID=UPI0008060CCC|nr:SpoIIE family protein phosphatase [Flammeovirga sp. MY04]ANQ47842.1 SpoIIE family protein phosphatase [Flammeovirga sp. MY04]
MYIISILSLSFLVIALFMVIRKTKLQKQKVEQVKEELDKALLEVNEQNIKITNSLRAAQTIQHAILPPSELLKKVFNSYFTIYRPKDIVSGDFYWYGESQGEDNITYKYFACVDCTGHGVPGALMSMIGKTILQEIVDKGLAKDPAKILEMINTRIISYLRQQENSINDGMDISLIRFTDQEGSVKSIDFAGAKSDIYKIDKQKNTLKRYRGSRKFIGGHQRKDINFSTTNIPINKGDYIFMLTDGLLDQNNIKNDKFGRRYFEDYLRQHSNNPLKDVGDLLEAALDVHQKNVPQRDDITVIGIEMK